MSIDAGVRLADGDHVVQFYDSDVDLLGAVGSYLTGALLAGDSVIVIATPAHRAAFEGAMAEHVDLDEARAEGRLVVADAAETLDRFVVDGDVDPARFDDVIGGLVRSAVAGGRPVRAYGEMVAVLWDAGAVNAAIELEALWNDLGERSPFSLFCAYAAASVAAPGVAEALAEVCHLHTHVVGGASDEARPRASRRFTASSEAPRLARNFVAEALQAWGRGDLVEDANLVVAELATNAVKHARSDFSVTVTEHDGHVRFEVEDRSATPPQPRLPDVPTPGGRGLVIIGGLTSDWGHRRTSGGKVVWADVPTPRLATVS